MNAGRRLSALLLLTAVGGAGAGIGDAHAAPPKPVEVSGSTRCMAAAFAAPVPADATITSADFKSAPTAHCRVQGTITTRDPRPNMINFSLALPDKFNGRYVYEAPGGSAGKVMEPRQAWLAQGYAVATSDQGTRPAHVLDFQWRNDPAQLLDYNYRAVHLVGQLTQAFTHSYFGAKPVRYIVGCSAGGRSGRNSMRVFGAADFDGVLAAPAPANAANQIGLARIAQYIERHPESWIAPELLKKAEEKIIATYDDSDGVADGIVQDDRLIRFDPSILKEVGFTPEQIKLVDYIRSAWPYPSEQKPTTSDGQWPGLGVSRVTEWTFWAIGSVPPPWSAAATGAPAGFLVGASTMRALAGPEFNWIKDFNFASASDIRRWTNGIGESASTGGFDYSGFAKGGGKAIFYVGVGDAAVSFRDQLLNRNEMKRHSPDQDSWNRLYLVPAWGHCGPTGGAGPDEEAVMSSLLAALTKWVERGEAPDAVVAGRAASSLRPAREFVLCPEPEIATLKGGAEDINASANWHCSLPGAR